MSRSIARLFTEHPQSVDESYFQHLTVASWFALKMLLASLACLVHALLPFLFVDTGSRQIKQLYQRMVISRRSSNAAMPAVEPAGEH